MINTRVEKKMQDVVIKESISCDVCGTTYEYPTPEGSTEAVFEIQEFTRLNFTGGYGSVFGDGDNVRLDICQGCLKEKLGKYLRIIEEGY